MLHVLLLRPDPFSVPLSPLASFIYYGFATGAATFFAFSYTGASFKFVRPNCPPAVRNTHHSTLSAHLSPARPAPLDRQSSPTCGMTT